MASITVSLTPRTIFQLTTSSEAVINNNAQHHKTTSTNFAVDVENNQGGLRLQIYYG